MATVDLVVLGSPPGGEQERVLFQAHSYCLDSGLLEFVRVLPYLVSDIKNEIGKNK